MATTHACRRRDSLEFNSMLRAVFSTPDVALQCGQYAVCSGVLDKSTRISYSI